MKVSVICIADRPYRLPLLFWSLVAQTHIDWELIVLDQSGDSHGVDVMLPVIPAADIGKVRVVRVDRAGDWGQSAKEKAARDYASGSVLMFPNDDAYYVPTALESLTSLIKGGADVALCGWLYNQMGYIAMPPSTQEGYVDVGGFAITRRMFARIGWPDKTQVGDAKLLEACVRSGARIGVTLQVLYVKN